jgi:hypothetical protein
MKSPSHSAVGVTAFSPSVDAGPSTGCGSLQSQDSKNRAPILIATHDKADVEQQALATVVILMAFHQSATQFARMAEEAMNLIANKYLRYTRDGDYVPHERDRRRPVLLND